MRKSRYDLGKSFFTNITPGYQLYPTVLLLPWTDPSAPGDYFLLLYTCRWDAQPVKWGVPAQVCRSGSSSTPGAPGPGSGRALTLGTPPHPLATPRTGQVVRFTSDGNFLPMWNMPGLEPQVRSALLALN